MIEDFQVFRRSYEVDLHDESVHQSGRGRVHFCLQLPEQEVADMLVVQCSFLLKQKFSNEVKEIVTNFICLNELLFSFCFTICVNHQGYNYEDEVLMLLIFIS